MTDMLVQRPLENAEICEVPIADFESTLRSLGYEISDSEFRLAHAEPKGLCRLLIRKNAAVAHAAMLVGFDGVTGWIHGLWVSREHQRRGHGRALIMEAEKWLGVAALTAFISKSATTNLSALGFCDRVGYRFYDAVVLAKSVRSVGNEEEG